MAYAAKKTDGCLHRGEVTSGSPDTKILGQPAARLSDTHVCKAHAPPPGPGLGTGVIVEASSTVFINRLGAARKGDMILCKPPGAAPPGTANPVTSQYDVRDEDHLEKIMEVEHEIAARDVVKQADGPEKGPSASLSAPAGVATARVPKLRPQKVPPSAESIVLKPPKDGQRAPYSIDLERTRETLAKKVGSNVQKPTRAGELAIGGFTIAVVIGRPSDQPPGAEGAKAPMTYKDEQDRRHVTLNLGFAMDLSVGSRSGSSVPGKGPDMISIVPCSVHTG